MYVRAPRPAPTLVTLIAGVLITTSGCSPEREGEPPAPASPPATTSAKAAVAPLTSGQLKALTFKDGEVPGAYEGGLAVRDPVPEGEGRDFPPVSDSDCQTVRDISGGKHASAVVLQVFNWKGDIWGGGSTLASYEDGKARQTFARLKQALASCHSFEGFGYTGKFTATLTAEKAPGVGDESVRFREIAPLDHDGDRSEEWTLVRTGNAIAVFRKLNVGADSSFPSALISTQVGRLRDAQR